MKKKIIIAAAIFLILGVSVGLAVLYNNINKDEEENKQIVVSAQLPELKVYYGKDQVGVIDGYTMLISDAMVRDVIVPVTPDRQASFVINTNGNKISNIYYEVAKIGEVEMTESGNLVDAGEITEYTEKEDEISFSYKNSTILETNTEYYLRIILKTDTYEQINYYARVMVLEDEFVTEQVKFAKNFSNQIFDDENAKKLALYLETDNKATHDNLGQVTIKTNYSMLVWGTLIPEKTTDTDITIKEICIKDSGQAATYTMNYQMKATNGEDITETYNVAETITVWTCAGKLYVLAYNREVNQVWEATANNVGNSFIDLGIQNKTQIEFVESTSGQYLSYAINGSVYLLDMDNKQIKPVYKFQADNADALTKTKAKAINVDDKGNVYYVLYGYSVAEEHLGKNGMSIMHYDNATKIAEEVVFIPCEMSAEMLEEQVDKLCQIGDGTCYVMINNTIYYVNLNTKEWGTLAENLEAGSYAISKDETLLAYNVTGTVRGATSIVVVNLITGEKREVTHNGENIDVCGYTANNLIYGVGKEGENTEFFPMYKMVILDETLSEVKTYEQKNVLIKNVEIQDEVINIKRWKKGKDIADDQLLDNTEGKEPVAKSSYYLDDVKMRELALSFTANLNSSINLGVASEAENQFVRNSEITAELITDNQKKYYVYGYGKFQGVYLDRREAIKAARDVYGLIVDETGTKIWTLEENYE